jgi:hypothetical protein
MPDTFETVEDLAAQNQQMFSVMKELLEERGADGDVLAALDKAATGQAMACEVLGQLVIGGEIVNDIEAVVMKAEASDARAFQYQLDQAVRDAGKVLTAAQAKIPGKKKYLDTTVQAERQAQDAAWQSEEFARACDSDLRAVRDKNSPPEAEAAAMAKSRDAADIVTRRQATLRQAVGARQAAQKELVDTEADANAAQKDLHAVQAKAASPPRAPYSIYTLAFLSPWLVQYGAHKLTDEELSFVRGIVLELARQTGVDLIIARDERARIKAERKTVSDRAIQSLSKRGARVQPPPTGNVDGSVTARSRA